MQAMGSGSNKKPSINHFLGIYRDTRAATGDIRFNGTTFIMRAKHMAKLRKLQPNIHGGPTHLVGSLGNHTFDTILSRGTVTLDLAVSRVRAIFTGRR